MVYTEIEENTFLAHLQTLQKPKELNHLLDDLRQKGWNRFLELGLPSKKVEAYRYVKLRNLYNKSYSLPPINFQKNLQYKDLVSEESKHSYLLFINGIFYPELSDTTAIPTSVAISTFNTAEDSFGSFLKNSITKSIKEEQDAFAALNLGQLQEGLFVYIPPKCVILPPIQIVNLYYADFPIAVSPRIHVFAGKLSQSSFATTHHFCTSVDTFINFVTDFTIEEDAKVDFFQSTLNQPFNNWILDATRAQLKRNSCFKVVCLTNGSSTIRYDYKVSLTGENSEASLNGLALLNKANESHSHVLMIHHAPHCRSMQLFKNILNDNSHASFEGKIFVHQIAQKTEAYQLNQNLLLNDHATIESKPNLEIFADDVKASHGATIGQLDKEQIFYLQTRGFNLSSAKNLLIKSFCEEILAMTPFKYSFDEIQPTAPEVVN
ncbi:MAG: Fe-S cluster assembly protein SufD [Chlamydia sp. 32-24]|nr:MAG: Fe-S cluster assembly protein SufD [Chlamydia sp. 32-24]